MPRNKYVTWYRNYMCLSFDFPPKKAISLWLPKYDISNLLVEL